MEYVARHYFPLKTGLATPGEILTDLPEDIVPRLLAKGAIETIAPATAAAKPEKKPAKKAKAQPEEAPEAEVPEAEAPETEAETEAPENEAETEAEDETEAFSEPPPFPQADAVRTKAAARAAASIFFLKFHTPFSK